VTGGITLVTGTGTDVGKTIVTAALAARATTAGQRVAAVKPAQTGLLPDQPGDLAVVQSLGGAHTLLEPVRLPDPLAPDTAARRAGIALPPIADTAAQIVDLADTHDLVLVEGAGGLLVRLDSTGATLADLAEALQAAGTRPQIIIAVAAGLGTLNATELTVEALRVRGLHPTGLIIGSWPAQPGLAEHCNLHDLPRSGVPLLGRIPAGAAALSPADFRAAAPTWLTG
jgi:dethiobiotin synthetase